MDSAFAEYVALRMARPRFANACSIRNATDCLRLPLRLPLVAADGVIARDDLMEIIVADVRADLLFKILAGPRLPGPPQPRRMVTRSRGTALIWACVNRSVTHCLRENSAVWSLKCGESGLADSE